MVCAIGEELENVSLADRVAAQRAVFLGSSQDVQTFDIFSFPDVLPCTTAFEGNCQMCLK